MATIDVDIDIDDYLEEADTDSLISELESRGYECSQDASSYSPDRIYLENLSGHELRDHLLTITMMGHHVSEEDMFNKLKELMKR